MAATKYQVMYRYMNHIMNVPITNDQNSTYEPTFEFYTDPDHRIFDTDQDIQNEELEKQQEMIAFANQASNPKNDMLFVYDGCKKVPHKKWVPDQIGYIVRDWSTIRAKIGNRGDFTKEFTCLNAETPEDGAMVICTQSVFRKYFPGNILVCSTGEFESAEVQEMTTLATFFELDEPNWKVHANPCGKTDIWSERWYGGSVVASDYTGPIFVDSSRDITTVSGYYGYTNHWDTHKIHADGTDAYTSIVLKPSDVKTGTIPGHYEDSPDAPYVVMDQYKHIESSPWLINCTVGSLEAALTKAKKLIEMIGIENVKIIKLVALDQFVKIK